MGAQGCVVARSQHEFLDQIGKLEGMGYVCRGIRGEFYMTDSAKRELTYAFSLHKPRMLCQPRLNHFRNFGYTGSSPFELLKYLVDDAGWTWRPGLALKRGVHMIVGDRSPANCILYGGQSLATLRVFALAAREPETFTKKNVTQIGHCLKDIKYEALFNYVTSLSSGDDGLEAALEDMMDEAEEETEEEEEEQTLEELALEPLEDIVPDDLNGPNREELWAELFGDGEDGPLDPALEHETFAETISVDGMLDTGAGMLSGDRPSAVDWELLGAGDEVEVVVRAAAALGLEVYQGASWRWGGFVITYVAATAGSTSAWQAKCPYHKLSEVSDCKKRMTNPDFNGLQSHQATLCRLLWWCSQAPLFERQRHHIIFHPMPADTPDVAVVLNSIIHLPALDERSIATDQALDLQQGALGLPLGLRGALVDDERAIEEGRGRGRGRGRPRGSGRGPRRARGSGGRGRAGNTGDVARDGFVPGSHLPGPSTGGTQQASAHSEHAGPVPARGGRGRGGARGRPKRSPPPDMGGTLGQTISSEFEPPANAPAHKRRRRGQVQGAQASVCAHGPPSETSSSSSDTASSSSSSSSSSQQTHGSSGSE
jgi:hypothetical protein